MDTLQVEKNHKHKISHSVLGMLFFTTVELMFFMGLISAFFIAKNSTSIWPPLGQPRLPIASTAINTLILLASGILLYLSHKEYKLTAQFTTQSKKLFSYALILGSCFILFQGVEWARLIGYGLTVQSSAYGSFFYVIIGAHALHAIVALFIMGSVFFQPSFSEDRYYASHVFWYFVVGMWPLLYLLIYIL